MITWAVLSIITYVVIIYLRIRTGDLPSNYDAPDWSVMAILSIAYPLGWLLLLLFGVKTLTIFVEKKMRE